MWDQATASDGCPLLLSSNGRAMPLGETIRSAGGGTISWDLFGCLLRMGLVGTSLPNVCMNLPTARNFHPNPKFCLCSHRSIERLPWALHQRFHRGAKKKVTRSPWSHATGVAASSVYWRQYAKILRWVTEEVVRVQALKTREMDMARHGLCVLKFIFWRLSCDPKSYINDPR